jgi:hypothetical protein
MEEVYGIAASGTTHTSPQLTRGRRYRCPTFEYRDGGPRRTKTSDERLAESSAPTVDVDGSVSALNYLALEVPMSTSLRVALMLALFSLGFSSVAYAEAEYTDADGTVSHDCAKDPEVSISGSSSTYTITGACAMVSVTGSTNKVTIESSEKVAVTGSMNEVNVAATNKISVLGTSNKVAWKKAIKGKKPKISSTGVGNKVSKAK